MSDVASKFESTREKSSHHLILRLANLLCGLTMVLIIGGCGTISRVEGPTYVAPGALTRTEDPRVSANDPAEFEAFSRRYAERLTASGGASTVLALSGGGANGAYGAGVLYGWTRAGGRPQFDVVTGVSTGALAAPFAFLGPAWDEQLRSAYLDGGADGLIGMRNLATLVAPSLFSPSILSRLVEKNVTPEMLRAIAVEHAKGRRLLVITTNLDTQETVTWDMGVIATQGDDQALKLFRTVLLASASIPVVFPPVMISGATPDGAVVQEMHVDGGVNAPFFAVPNEFLLAKLPLPPGASVQIYVLINGKIEAEKRITPGTVVGILSRSYDSMSKASLKTLLIATQAFAVRNHVALSTASIPADVEASSLKFEAKAMRQLFEVGQARAQAGTAWTMAKEPALLGPPPTPGNCTTPCVVSH